jgi:F plasmid transfer operon, TraF, protein
MKLEKSVPTIVLTAGLLVSTGVQAASFGNYDPRSLGLGGVGVTMATARNANFFNPAMLSATRSDDDFAIGLPIVSARVADADKALDNIDALETSGKNLSNALTALDAAGTNPVALQPAAAAAGSALATFSNDLGKISNKVLDADLFAGGIMTIPSKKFGVGLHVSGRANFGAKFIYAANDKNAIIDPLSANLISCAANPVANSGACTNAQNAVVNGKINGLQSTLQVRGIAVSEVGLAFARRFESVGDADIGITLKGQRIRTYDYSISAQDTKIDLKLGERQESAANFDVGFARSYGENFKSGVVIKNVLKKEFTTVLGNKIELKPQARMGVSYHRSWVNLGVDLDLTKNKPVAEGFDKETQFAAIGAELDLIGTLQLRMGYRHDLAGNYDGMPSLGLGFSPFGMHIDVAVAGNSKEVAAGAQLGFNF